MKSEGPASIRRIRRSGRYSARREAMTQPAVPPPIIKKSTLLASAEEMVLVVILASLTFSKTGSGEKE
jgi:hypothetical protein